MPSGRKPLPARLHRLHGNPHGHRLPNEGDEPRPPTSLCPAPPEWMDAQQRETWRHAIENAPLGMLAEIDQGILSVWVCSCVEYQRAAAEVRKAGQLVEGRDERMIASPYLGIMNRMAALLIRCASELGYSPASRASLGMRATRGCSFATNDSDGSRLAAYLRSKPDKMN